MSEGRNPEALWRKIAEVQDTRAGAPADTESLLRGLGQALTPGRRERRWPGFGWSGSPAAAGKSWGRVWAAGLLLVGGAAVAAIALWVSEAAPPRLAFELAPGGEIGRAGQTLVAEAKADLPLRFSDGSLVTFEADSRGQVARLDGAGAEVVLERGRLEAEVVHADRTRWVVRAGPFEVRVTGTRFGVDWSPKNGRLAVDLREGGVVVGGDLLGPGVSLRAGQRLTVDRRGGLIEMRPLESEPATAEPRPALPPQRGVGATAPAPAPGAKAGKARGPAAETERGQPAPAPLSGSKPSWRRLARQGQFALALQAAESAGFDDLLESLDAPGLLALGDVGRYAGRPDRAERAFVRLVERFGHHPSAGDAVFTLGRLAFEAGQPAQAATWFARYRRDWPEGPLGEQATGRLLESAERAGQAALAEEAAHDYLARYDRGAYSGSYAGLARVILERAAGGTP